MAGSAGFLSMEVKLDLDKAQKAIEDLGQVAKREFGKPITIDTSSLQALSGSLSTLEKSYADVLRVSQQINEATKNTAQSTRDMASAMQQANRARGQSLQELKEEQRTLRENVKLQAKEVEAAGRVAAAETKAQGGLAVVQAQTQAAQDRLSATQKQRDLEAQVKAAIKEAADEQRRAAKASREAGQEATRAARDLAAAEREVAKEQARATKEAEKQAVALAAAAKEASIMRASGAAMAGGATWITTAVGAASARNYGYSLGALFQAAKAVFGALAALPPQAKAAAVAFIAATAATVGTAMAIGTLSKRIAELGTSEAVGMETLVLQLNAMLPTAEMARKEIEGLFDLGTRTIAPTAVLIELDRRLLMAGGSAAIMRQQVVEGFAAFSSASGLTTEQMNSLNYLIGEVTLKGRLMNTEMSQQFSSAGLGKAAFLEETAKATGLSVDQLNQKLKEGTFDATLFLQGLTAYFNSFNGSAQAALGSVSALTANIKDAVKASIGKAFYDSGVTAALSSILKQVQGLVAAVAPYFAVIAAKVNQFFTAISDGMRRLAGSGGTSAINFIFGVAIPAAIELATRAVAALMLAFQAIMPAIKVLVKSAVILWRSLTSTGSGFKVLAALALAPVVALGVLAAAIRIVIAFAYALANGVLAVSRVLRFDFAGAAAAGYAAVGHVVAGFRDATSIVSGFASAASSAGQALGNLSSTGAPNLPDSGRQPAGGSGEGGAGGGGGRGGSSKASRAASELAAALNELWEQTRRWMGMRSEIEKSLTGGATGFTASAEQIMEAGASIVKTLAKAGYGAKSGLVKWLTREIKQLAALAVERDRLTKVLEEQQSQLDTLRADRAQMSADIARGIVDFAAALATEQETVTEYTRLDAFGSFIISEKKKTKSYVEQMRERLEVTRKFIADLRKLQARGLDPRLIAQLAAAGPEAAAAAVAELGSASDETLAEVNDMTEEIHSISAEFGDDMAGDYYDAAIAAAEALIKGTQDKIAAVEKAAEKMAEAINKKLAAIAKPAKDAGSQAGGAFAGGVGDGAAAGFKSAPIGAFGAWAGKEIKSGLGKIAAFDTNFEQIGRDFVGGIWKGMKEGFFNNPVVRWVADHIVNPIRDFFEIRSPSQLMARIGRDIIQGLWNGMTSWFGDIRDWISQRFDAAKTWLTVTFPEWLRTNASTVWGNVKTGLSGVKEWFAERFDSLQTWWSVTFPNWISKNTPWGNLFDNFPDVLAKIKSKFAAAIDWLTGTDSYAGAGFPRAVKNGLNTAISAWNSLEFTFPSFVGDWNGPLPGGKFTLGGWTLRTPNVPLLAAGGVVTRPTLAGIGERGTEAVLPLENPQSMRMIADAIAGAGGGIGSIQVFIGDREITDIVRVEVAGANRREAIRTYAGRGS